MNIKLANMITIATITNIIIQQIQILTKTLQKRLQYNITMDFNKLGKLTADQLMQELENLEKLGMLYNVRESQYEELWALPLTMLFAKALVRISKLPKGEHRVIIEALPEKTVTTKNGIQFQSMSALITLNLSNGHKARFFMNRAKWLEEGTYYDGEVEVYSIKNKETGKVYFKVRPTEEV